VQDSFLEVYAPDSYIDYIWRKEGIFYNQFFRFLFVACSKKIQSESSQEKKKVRMAQTRTPNQP
jgi:hypothetical protein